MAALNRYLLQILGAGWMLFLVAGWAIAYSSPGSVVLIDRSYCAPTQWQQVAQAYERHYQTSRLQTVILFNDLSQENLSPAPTPSVVRNLTTYGRSNPVRLSELQRIYPNAQLLNCRS
ncbi:hypothetical protein C7B65_19905 [Phormidesmis priestleyi ULC007]|uniref:Uncharacterized protein n=1 Tax=Phormidesmis priestleyi ULC007 TaxID=1920490 RepID=A0A2T1D986_9CYAN|nr:hypothetical protein [Phormidesmis priestleyi]PSB17078.1 hypothetical protein C7B65_19905 [Phormidesmis priestleyi ULC007]PZO48172.1 MAG: hypothetical protein DCF14_17715 [Phormidesmis priestleyi]